MQVAVVVPVFNRLVTDIVGGAMDHARFHSTAGQPNRTNHVGYGRDPVVFCDQGLLPNSLDTPPPGFPRAFPLLQIANQTGNRLVDRPAQRRVRFDIAVSIPGPVTTAGMANLNVAYPLSASRRAARVVGQNHRSLWRQSRSEIRAPVAVHSKSRPSRGALTSCVGAASS